MIFKVLSENDVPFEPSLKKITTKHFPWLNAIFTAHPGVLLRSVKLVKIFAFTKEIIVF